ncbi:hypothetical protein [Olleya namhaensis]|uniref:hypothetical protein n=1 Tax=Olleya namhaensis TaxID=1144750 RepID=UPI002493578F|nr:hypothetical protein [Olleya namhaensis]
MKSTLSLFSLIPFLPCKEEVKIQTIEGNIYITLINFYNPNVLVPIDKINEFKNNVLKFNPEGKSKSEIQMTKYYKTLIDNNLFGKPIFQVKLENEEIINVYTDDSEYLKLKKI